jgi:hypothetical protein
MGDLCIHIHIYEDYVKWYFKGTECASVDWIQFALDRAKQQILVNTVMKISVSQKPVNFPSSLMTVSFSRRTMLV